MPKTPSIDVNKILLEAHKRGIEQAIDLSIRTGVPLVVEREGKIIELKPQYKYVKVPIKSAKKKPHSKTGNIG
jgi:hypothetical protein